MPCYHPFDAWRAPSGAVSVGYEVADSQPLKLPCGNCYGCMKERARDWSVRCQHEASCWSSSCFLTLTYDDEHLPKDHNLVPRDLQLFMMRFRQRVNGVDSLPDGSRPVRFFACGEYGDRTQRPHYHVLLFNVSLPRNKMLGASRYSSDVLDRSWKLGHAVVDQVTSRSIAYVARYCVKKLRRKRQEWVKAQTGEVVPRVPEFGRMSLRPAIGQYWFDKYSSDLCRGYCVVDGRKVRLPRFYTDKLIEKYPDFELKQSDRKEEYLISKAFERMDQHDRDVAEIVDKARDRMYRGDSVL